MKKKNNKPKHYVLKTESNEINNIPKRRNTTINVNSTNKSDKKLMYLEQYANYMEKMRNKNTQVVSFNMIKKKISSDKILERANKTSNKFFKIKNIVNEK